jgi:predicted metal-dependent phosphoesterase TrpH
MIEKRRFCITRRWFLLLGLFAVGFWGSAFLAVAGEARWYKGNTHAHSFWSDGDEFPEMAADWYKSHGYQFLALTDHDGLAEGDRWKPIDHGKRPVPSAVLEKCRRRFGDKWLEIRSEKDHQEVKLKTFNEISAKLAEPGKFLLIPGEEISDQYQDRAVHINALNPFEPIKPQGGKSAADTILRDLAAVARQAEQLHRPIIAHVNHPYWKRYDLAPEDLASVKQVQFYELCNGGVSKYFLGDAAHPGNERFWDIVNSIRLMRMKFPPVYAVGADDTHSYQKFSTKNANPGRAWIVVRSEKLAADSLIEAMNRGDYYVSTGVVLKDVAFDVKTRTLRVAVRAEPGVHYTIEFVGTLEGVDPKATPVPDNPEGDKNAKKYVRPGCRYSPDIGRVLESVEGADAEYRMTGVELYVRAVVRSDKTVSYSSAGGPKESAWCQPVGWKAGQPTKK